MSDNASLQFMVSVLADPTLLRDSDACNRLLKECYSLADAQCLSPLLEHENNRVVANAVCIVSELGRRSHSLLPVVLRLLRYRDEGVRYWTVIALHSMVKILSAHDLAQLLQLIAEDDWDGIRIRGLEVIVSLRSPDCQQPNALDSLGELHVHSPYVYLAAHLQATGKVPGSLAVESKPPLEAEVLRHKLELLFQCLDDWVEFTPSSSAPYDDVSYIVRWKIESKKRRATRRELLAEMDTARENGDKEVFEIAWKKLKEMSSPEASSAFVKSVRSSK